MIELKNIGITFNKNTPDENTALKNINLSINKGDFITVIGSNGAGKSTLYNVISGTYSPTEGAIFLETENGIVEVPVDVELDPTSNTKNGLENGWKGAEIGTVVYGTEECGLVAAETTIGWIGYRMALIVDGVEVPYTSVTYNLTVSGLTFE